MMWNYVNATTPTFLLILIQLFFFKKRKKKSRERRVFRSEPSWNDLTVVSASDKQRWVLRHTPLRPRQGSTVLRSASFFSPSSSWLQHSTNSWLSHPRQWNKISFSWNAFDWLLLCYSPQRLFQGQLVLFQGLSVVHLKKLGEPVTMFTRTVKSSYKYSQTRQTNCTAAVPVYKHRRGMDLLTKVCPTLQE